MRKWPAAFAVVALSATFAACGSDDDTDVPGGSTPPGETIDTAVDMTIDGIEDLEDPDTDDSGAPVDTSMSSTQPPTAGGSPGTSVAGAATPGT